MHVCMYVCWIERAVDALLSGLSLDNVCMCVPERGSTCSSIWLHTKIMYFILSSCATGHWASSTTRAWIPQYYSVCVVFVYAWIICNRMLWLCFSMLLRCLYVYVCHHGVLVLSLAHFSLFAVILLLLLLLLFIVSCMIVYV